MSAEIDAILIDPTKLQIQICWKGRQTQLLLECEWSGQNLFKIVMMTIFYMRS